MREEVLLATIRTRKARLSRYFNPAMQRLCGAFAFALFAAGAYCLTLGEMPQPGYAALSVGCALATLSLWGKYDLRHILPSHSPAVLDDVIEPHLLGLLKKNLTPQQAWDIAVKTPEAKFMVNRLLFPTKGTAQHLGASTQDMAIVWHQAHVMQANMGAAQLHGGTLIAALMLTSPVTQMYLTQNKLTAEDVTETLNWLERQLSYFNQPKPRYGGIGRDWATGFTPTLERFSQNISLSVQAGGGVAFYMAHSELLPGIVSSLARGNGVALIGAEGVGKTTLIQGLAEHLLEGRERSLQYYQVVSLNASLILSHSEDQLENLVLTLFGEAIASGNMIIFLEDAHLFFGTGTGAFDMSQVLLPVLKNRNIKIIASFDPIGWQQLQARQPALTTSFASIVVNEPDKAATMKVIEDSVMFLEHRNNILVSYEAVREAYRLSGQYMQEESYPGKAVHLLELSLTYSDKGLMTAQAVQMAIEQTRGVKVSAAQAPEAAMLLGLEDRIHERMINQKRAVNVVASALRRGRAGVSNPKRPVGSFLFLGPTGVGKTELARSLAAVYFGDERQMIRLDMSEYQRPEDVSRLLAAGGQQEQSLLLAIRRQPFSVVLFDEIEKAHPNILNLFLQMLDEGQLTDAQGRPASFRSSIIIATSNAGAADITARVREGQPLDNFERPLIDKLINSGQFRPELVNRFDEVVLFRPLNEEELALVANVMLSGVNKTLSAQQISVQLTPAALKEIVHLGYDPEFGARPMRRIIQKTVENAVAVKILRNEAQPGSTILLDIGDLHTGDS